MENDEYLFYKGLQKPLEFMGIRGRFIIIAAVTVVGSFLSYFLLTVFLESIIAVFVTVTFAFGGLITIYLKQKQGLHAKRRTRGLFVYHNLWERTKAE